MGQPWTKHLRCQHSLLFRSQPLARVAPAPGEPARSVSFHTCKTESGYLPTGLWELSESLHTKHGRCPPQVTMTAVWQPRGKAHGRVSMAAGLLKASLHDSLSGLTTTAHRRSTASSSACRCKCPPERFSTGVRPVSPRRGWPWRDARGHHSWGRAWALGGRRRA